jgi:hypothetical protein
MADDTQKTVFGPSKEETNHKKQEENAYTRKLNILVSNITKVEIEVGHVKSDPTTWNIHFKGDKVIRINSKKIEVESVFRQEYITTFNKASPFFKKKDWGTFVGYLSDIATVVQSKEETENVYVAQQLMEILLEYNITTDSNMIIQKNAFGRFFFDNGNKYCVLSNQIKHEVEEELGFKFNPKILSETLTDLGYKDAGTTAIRINGKRPRFWLFDKKVIDDLKQG